MVHIDDDVLDLFFFHFIVVVVVDSRDSNIFFFWYTHTFIVGKYFCHGSNHGIAVKTKQNAIINDEKLSGTPYALS